MRGFSARLAVCFLAVFILFWMPTLKIAYYNPGPFTPQIIDLAIICAGLALACSVLLSPFLAVRPVGRLVLYLALGAAAAALINTYLMPSEHTVLDGALNATLQPDPAKWWLAAIAISSGLCLWFLSFRKPAVAHAIARTSLIGMAIYSVLFSGLAFFEQARPGESKLLELAVKGDRGWPLSRDSNIIVLSFDQMQGSVAAGVLRRHPELAARFDGFRLFTDAASVYPNTSYSLMGTLTGKMPQRARKEAVPDALAGPNFVRSGLESGMAGGAAIARSRCDICFPKVPSSLARGDLLSQVGALSLLAVNQAFGSDGRWVARLAATVSRTPLGATASQYAWKLDIDEFRTATQELQLTSAKPVIEFRHYYSTHQPILYDQNCALRPEDEIATGQTLAAAENEVLCVLTSVATFLDRLKAEGVYDRTMIFLLSDHGYEANINAQQRSELAEALLFPGSEMTGRMNIKPAGGYNPTLFFKDFDATGPAVEDGAPASLLDVSATLCNAVFPCDFASEGMTLREPIPQDRERRYWRYFGGSDRLQDGKDRLHEGLDEWWEPRSFRGTLQAGLVSSIWSYDDPTRQRVSAGNTIAFAAEGNARPYMLQGWSGQEDWGTWTDGVIARLDLPLGNDMPDHVVVDAVGFTPREGDTVRMTARVNGRDLGTADYQHGQEQQQAAFDLPDGLPTNTPVLFEFVIDKPHSPRELGLSQDDRLLGVGISAIHFEKLR